MKRKKRWLLLPVMCLILLLAACGENSEIQAPQAPQAAVFYDTCAGEYGNQLSAVLNTALNGAGIIYQQYSTAFRLIQLNQIDEAVAQGIQLLIIDPIGTEDADVLTILEKARAAGIGVIFIDCDVSRDLLSGYDKACCVRNDDEMLEITQGRMVGEYLLAHFEEADLNGDGIISYILLQGDTGDDTAQLSVRKAKQVLADGSRAVLQVYDGGDESEPLTDDSADQDAQVGKAFMNAVMEQYTLENNNMVECIFAVSDDLALEATEALQETGYNCEGGIRIGVFGIGGSSQARAAVDAGSLTGTVYVDTDAAAETICRIAESLIRDGTLPEGQYITIANKICVQP